jgi:uncharacterized protein involved in response to NO
MPRCRVAAAFGLVNLAVTRGLLPILYPQWFFQLIIVSGALWVAAFVIFVVLYLPILTYLGIGGRPG